MNSSITGQDKFLKFVSSVTTMFSDGITSNSSKEMELNFWEFSIFGLMALMPVESGVLGSSPT